MCICRQIICGIRDLKQYEHICHGLEEPTNKFGRNA
uniref:Uncharacterized protein n=1 Tax=Arundo donax TaxID=35708 RepID=A0A0A8YFS3_ARUDO